MVEYASEDVFPAPREKVWALLRAHLDPSLATRIHPKILSQTEVSRDGDSVVVEREIDARGRRLRSRWKVTLRPPELGRWEIVDGEGPYAPGSFVESRYSDAPGGTHITARGNLKITVLPFFLPQGPVVRRVLDDIDREDRAYLKSAP